MRHRLALSAATLNRSVARSASALALLALTSCGGGGNGSFAPAGASAPPPAPAQSLAAPANFSASYGMKRYDFSWNAVNDATYYELMEDPDGAGPQAAAAIGGHLASTSFSHAIELFGRLNASYTVRACNAVGCGSDSAAFSPDVNQAVGYFKASNTLTGGIDGTFGYAIAFSADGSTMAVGAQGESSAGTGIDGDPSSTSAPFAGAVYVFTRVDGAWTQQAYVKASNTGAGDAFGKSVALSADGNTLAVGAFTEDSSDTGVNGNEADNSAADSGAVYVFSRAGSAWTQQAYVKASNTRPNGGFGQPVALSADGDVLAVGAAGDTSSATGINGSQADAGVPYAGAAFVFTRSGSAWTQQAYVKASNTGASYQFGHALALSGDGRTLAVGALSDASNAVGIDGDASNTSAPNAGSVHVFAFDGSAWSQQAYVKASNARGASYFGFSLALADDGGTLAVAAPLENSNATGIGGDPSNTGATAAGAVYVFDRAGATWSQQAYVKASNTASGGARFGYSVALSADGNSLAVGALDESSTGKGIDGSQSTLTANSSGAAYLFARSAGAWAQQHYLKAPNPDSGDNFGLSVALSADASTLAIGAPLEKSNATGIGGNQHDNTQNRAGALYLY